MNVIRKVTGILLALFVITVPIWLSTTDTATVLSSRNGRAPVGSDIDKSPVSQEGPTVNEPVYPTLSPVVRDLPPFEQEFALDREINPRINYLGDIPFNRKYTGGLDPLLAVQANAPERAIDAFDTPIVNYDGQGYSSVNPPDTVGDIGLDYYIQAINQSGGTLVQIYNKDGSTAVPAFSLDSLGAGNCTNGLGDPIILYDRLAGRWMLSEFSSGGNQLCMYVSQTADPTGSYYAYAFTAANSFPDYPKYGVWPDAYYAGTNESSTTLYAFDRNSMLTGAPATYQSFNVAGLSGFGFQEIIPSDLDGATAPPTNSPNYFMRHRDTENHGQGTCPVNAGGDCLEIFEFAVDWDTPGNSGINGPISIQVAEFDSDLCGLSSFNCFPQPGSGTTLDPLREVVMNRLQYRNFGTHETLVGNFVTDVDGSDHGGIRWFELRKSGASAWSLYQEGTYAPDASHRWMGAISMDGSGNIALGYNVSDATATYPSLRYVGRMNSDPAGTMPQGEYTIVDGTAANGSNRYGDYSAMGVDPADDCTFWFTGMYNVSSQWSTRIASFKFDGCSGAMSPNFDLSTTPTSLAICSPDDANYTVDVTGAGGFTGDVDLVASGEPGTATFTPGTVTADGSSALVIGGAAAGNYTFDIIGTGVTTPSLVHTNTVTLDVFAAAPQATALLLPANTATNIPTVPSYSWNATVDTVSYDIEIATDAGFSNIVDSANVDTNAYTSGVTLDTSTTYYWRVRANNGCGTGSYSAVFSFTTLAAPGDCGPGTVANALYSEDFESGTDIWTHGGTGDTWTMSTARPNSGTYSYYAEDVSSVSNQQLESPDVVLPNDSFPLSLQFWNWQTIEDGGAGCYDGALAEISSDGGSTWTQLDSELLTDSYDGPVDSGFSNPLAGLNAWCGDPQDWLNSIVDLNAYAGETVRFRFSLGTDSSASREGWYIDDFEVQSCVPDASTYDVNLSGDDAMSGLPNDIITYTLSLTNTGNVADTFTVSINNIWATTATATNIPLAAGASDTFNVMVTIPANANDGDNDVATITVTSDSDGSATDFADLTTTAVIHYIYLPVILK